jgi:hypothetical protein
MTLGQALRLLVRPASSALLVLLLGACAALPDVSHRAATMSRPAASDAPLGRLAAASLDDPSLGAFRLLVAGDEALEARLALIA